MSLLMMEGKSTKYPLELINEEEKYALNKDVNGGNEINSYEIKS